MRTSIITLLSASLISTQAIAMPVLVKNYNDALLELTAGANVKALIDFSKCESKEHPNEKTKVFARMNFNVFNYYEVEKNSGKFAIATSDTLLIDTDKFGPVKNYVRLRLFADDTAEIHSAYYDPKTYEVKKFSNYTCKISNGYDDNAIRLYEERA